MDKKKIISISIFAVILIAGIVFRLLYLHTDIWYDEACSWFTAKQSFPMGIMDNLLHLDLQHTPLYFFLLHFWIKLFGDSEVAMRTLSLLFGIGTLPLVYVATKKITNNKIALFSLAISAVSPLLVLFSAEVRMYPMVVFLVVLSLNFLIDFEQTKSTKSLVKLVITNLLIPYTLVGGILYNVALWGTYAPYLYSQNKKDFFKYIKGLGAEIVGLIPYFILISYYAKMRSIFVISHEGELAFFHIVDVIRNFFGATIVKNIYWPSFDSYQITFLFAMLVVVPCVYFVYGYIQGMKKSDGFLSALYKLFILSFCLSIVFSMFQVNIFTVRYILYLVTPMFILAIIGLFKTLPQKHVERFLVVFILACGIFNYFNARDFKVLKTLAFKTVRLESDKLNLGVDDIIIMPFGADAPYYFRDLYSPRVFDFDLHKELRNPYNTHFYDEKQQKDIIERQALTIYDAVMSNNVFSRNFFDYFTKNVNETVPKGRYVLIALYGSDADNITDIQTLRNSIPGDYVIPARKLEIMFKKFLCDVSVMLNMNFVPVKTFRQDNYTFFLYQKVK